MEVIIIGKPAINVYLPLQEFPQEGDLFTIKTKNESVGNVGATSACLLGKWGESAHFTGVVGNDSYAEKIRDTFKTNRVNSKFMETNFEFGTCVNYIILNSKTGLTTKILFNDFDVQLTKYKYDFIPNFAIIDGTDFSGAYALINNNGSCKTLFYARRGDKDTINLAKKCTYVVCTETYAEMLTRENADGSAEGYVNLYQKIVDASGKSNHIVILNNHKILYAVDGAVKMLPEMKINVTDYSSFDSIFVGALGFCLMHDISLDDAIKFANTAAAISLTRIGEEPSIPEVDEVLDNSGLREKFGLKEKNSRPAQAQEITPLMPNKDLQVTQNSTQGVSQVPENTMIQNQVQGQQESVNVFQQPVQQESINVFQSQTQQVSTPTNVQATSFNNPIEQNGTLPGMMNQQPVSNQPSNLGQETNMFDNPNV